ncbi:NFACT family protein [Candidatus Woesearchaeota archaeon]|nr:NFACT family protein [Candidatus Woesearchaeota archaeon]
MKGALSSFELRHVVRELQFLVGAKIEKVFQQEKPTDDFLFSLHVSGKGKQLLYVALPRLLCVSSFKPVFPDAPPGFCTSLRRKITNARITAIEQHHFEKIIKITLSTKHGSSNLIMEFIPPGNMLLTTEDNKILSVLHAKIWSEERKLLPGKQYSFPPEQLDPSLLSRPQFAELLQGSTKESVVKSLAIDCSLGGLYAEEVTHQAGVEKSKAPRALSEADVEQLYDALHDLFVAPTTPFIFNHEAFPILLKDVAGGVAKEPSFNEAIAKVALASLTKQEEVDANKDATQKLSKTETVIKKQEQMLVGLQQKEIDNQKKGELIYTHYAEIKVLLDKITDLRKLASWDEIEAMCEDIDLVEKVDKNTGTIYINVD